MRTNTLGGYRWDFKPDSTAPYVLGALDGGGASAPTGTPPGPRGAVDSYDRWGALFVGGETPAGINATPGSSADACFNEECGREQVFPAVTVDGLEVQRKVYVSATGLAGARIVTLGPQPGNGAADHLAPDRRHPERRPHLRQPGIRRRHRRAVELERRHRPDRR